MSWIAQSPWASFRSGTSDASCECRKQRHRSSSLTVSVIGGSSVLAEHVFTTIMQVEQPKTGFRARVAELADALDSKSSVLKDVWVQVPPLVLKSR
jgi:hypothetical protein